jgi:hypothetical protein
MARLRTLNVDAKSGREDILVLDQLTDAERVGRLDQVAMAWDGGPCIAVFPFSVDLPGDETEPEADVLAWKALALGLLDHLQSYPAMANTFTVFMDGRLPPHRMTAVDGAATLTLLGGRS